MNYWETLGRTVIACGDKEPAEKLTGFINYYGVAATISADDNTLRFNVAVPTDSVAAAIKPIEDFRKRFPEYDYKDASADEAENDDFITHGGQTMRLMFMCGGMDADDGKKHGTKNRTIKEKGSCNDPFQSDDFSPPLFVHAPKREGDDTKSRVFLILVGDFIIVMSIIQLAQLLHYSQYIRLPVSIVGICFGTSIMAIGVMAGIREKQRKIEEENERHRINEVVDWFLSTYSAQQLDDSIKARNAASEEPQILTPCEMRHQRVMMIYDYIEREYGASSIPVNQYITNEIYVSIYETPKLRQNYM